MFTVIFGLTGLVVGFFAGLIVLNLLGFFEWLHKAIGRLASNVLCLLLLTATTLGIGIYAGHTGYLLDMNNHEDERRYEESLVREELIFTEVEEISYLGIALLTCEEHPERLVIRRTYLPKIGLPYRIKRDGSRVVEMERIFEEQRTTLE